ncbi:type II toxin-antitoxin system Phd/YefM family antitoxin [Aureimonas mangrovi]|uniref:type II toxin-antitoxin system Phd/YefM family antitoxin n=1 Tax=Aureimonas mangrovi TaxID=2758041 RepID=UPI00163D905A|nr:type II toxin-antitoxin system Phd/YefM family antitoxin [Aureimonas mangrovi]
MRELQLKEAKATLSAVVEGLTAGGEAVTITRHGRPAAVVLGYEEWRRLATVPSLGRLLMSAPEGIEELPERSKAPLRELDL